MKQEHMKPLKKTKKGDGTLEETECVGAADKIADEPLRRRPVHLKTRDPHLKTKTN